MGYNNPSKFTRAFKSVYGVLPKDYRKMHRKEDVVGLEKAAGLDKVKEE